MYVCGLGEKESVFFCTPRKPLRPFLRVADIIPIVIKTSKVPGRCPWIQWMVNSNTLKKLLKIRNGDIFEHQETFSSTHKKIVKLQQHSELKWESKFYRVLLHSGHIVHEIKICYFFCHCIGSVHLSISCTNSVQEKRSGTVQEMSIVTLREESRKFPCQPDTFSE